MLQIKKKCIDNHIVNLLGLMMTKSSLKQRSKLIKIFYKSGLRKSDHTKVLEKLTECTKKILEAKKTIYLK